MPTGKSIVVLSVFAVLMIVSLKAQTASTSQDTYKPYSLGTDDSGLRARGSLKSPTAFTNTYVLVYPGPQGTAQGLPSGLAEEVSFPSVNFVFSAAAKLMTDELQEPGKVDGKWLSDAELKRLHVNVRIRGLGEDRRPLAPVRRTAVPGELEMRVRTEAAEEAPHVVVLALSPGESQFRTAESAVSKEMTSIDIFSRFMGPAAGLTTGVTALFKNWFRSKDSPTQVAYLTSDEEFGWSWRDAENFGIEGIHQCSAALRVRKEVKHLQVHVDFITDWRRFGAWMKGHDYIIPLSAVARN